MMLARGCLEEVLILNDLRDAIKRCVNDKHRQYEKHRLS